MHSVPQRHGLERAELFWLWGAVLVLVLGAFRMTMNDMFVGYAETVLVWCRPEDWLQDPFVDLNTQYEGKYEGT